MRDDDDRAASSPTIRDLRLDALAALSHDLSASLLTIQGFAHDLAGAKPDAEADNPAMRIARSGRMAQEKLAAAVDYLRLADAEVLESTVPMRALFDAVITRLSQRAAAPPFDCQIGDLAPAKGDPDMLMLLAECLIDNAAKFSRPGDNAMIRVSSTPLANAILYSIADEGVGIDERHADRIFGLFQRLHPQATPGLGVGLAFARLIVAKHGGWIRCRSRPNGGATFEFVLAAPAAHE